MIIIDYYWLLFTVDTQTNVRTRVRKYIAENKNSNLLVYQMENELFIYKKVNYVVTGIKGLQSNYPWIQPPDGLP